MGDLLARSLASFVVNAQLHFLPLEKSFFTMTISRQKSPATANGGGCHKLEAIYDIVTKNPLNSTDTTKVFFRFGQSLIDIRIAMTQRDSINFSPSTRPYLFMI